MIVFSDIATPVDVIESSKYKLVGTIGDGEADLTVHVGSGDITIKSGFYSKRSMKTEPTPQFYYHSSDGDYEVRGVLLVSTS